MLSDLILKVPRKQQVKVSRCGAVSGFEIGPNLFLHRLELRRAFADFPRQRSTESLRIDLQSQLRIGGEVLGQHPGEVESSVGGDPHRCFLEAGSS